MPATERREAAIRDNKIPRPNVVTWRAAAELTGAVTRYRRVRSNNNNNNNNNNNHTTLEKRFQPSTRDELRQLDLYTNADTPDTAHQLDAEAIAAKIRSYPENLRGYGFPPGGTLEGSIGQKDCESGEARRLRTGIVSLSHRGTEGCWHQVGVQN